MDTAQKLEAAKAKFTECERAEQEARTVLDSARERMQAEQADADAINAKLNAAADPDCDSEVLAKFITSRDNALTRVALFAARSKNAEATHGKAFDALREARAELRRAEAAVALEAFIADGESLAGEVAALFSTLRKRLPRHHELRNRCDAARRAAGDRDWDDVQAYFSRLNPQELLRALVFDVAAEILTVRTRREVGAEQSEASR